MAAALAAGALLFIAVATLAPGAARAAAKDPTVTLAVVRGEPTPALLAGEGMAVGLLSAGIGQVPAQRTFADISAGNRTPPPSDRIPGLLEATLARAGLAGSLRRVVVQPSGIPRLLAGLHGDGLLIAFAGPPPAADRGLAIGIAGRGFEGELSSDSTRTDGYVLSTDIAPTILDRLGVAVPSEMDGQPIRAEGRADPAAVEELGNRMAAIPQRRAPVLEVCLLAWIVIAAVVSRVAFAWLGLAFAYMPLTLLAGAWLEPGALAEGLLVGFGAAGLAALTVRFARGWRGLAIACAITVIAYAIDVIAGSGLTKLSLLGPNPIFGARFYGIGNELEALIAVMVPVGVGAALSARSGGSDAPNTGSEGEAGRGVVAGSFLVAGVLGGLIFGAGRFGADVGAAIVLPVGAAVAAATAGGIPSTFLPDGSGRPTGQDGQSCVAVAGLAAGAALAAVGVLLLIDVVSGANAHLTRSVLDAAGAGDLADTVERRLRLSAGDFAQAAGNPLFWIVIAGIAGAIWRWRRIDAWLSQAPPARAGFIGACAAVGAGVLVNDSGATFLVLGSFALGAALAFAWAQARPGTDP